LEQAALAPLLALLEATVQIQYLARLPVQAVAKAVVLLLSQKQMVPLVVLAAAVNQSAVPEQMAAQVIRHQLRHPKAVAVGLELEVRLMAAAGVVVHQQSAQTLEQVLVEMVAMGLRHLFLAAA